MMSVGVGHVAQARAHIAAGELSGAHELLRELLNVAPKDPTQAGPEQIEAAALLTGVLLALGEPFAARGWAAWGHAGHRHRYGEHDRRTLHTVGLLAAVLTRVGAHVRATARYQQLIDALTGLDGPVSDRVLAVRADLATVEHARGHCADARLGLASVIAEHRAQHGATHAVGVRMQVRLAAMWRDCGDFDRAHALLAQAGRDAVGIDADSVVHRLLDVAVRAPADPHHACGQSIEEQSTDERLTDERLTDERLTDGLPVRQAGGWAEPAAAPLTAPLFTPLDYLPPPPDLVPAHLAEARPAPSHQRAPQSAPPRRTYSAWVLAAGSAGIVLVTLLFLLVVSSVTSSSH